MRSLREIVFRLKQEIANVYLYSVRPSLRASLESPLRGLPDPDSIAGRLRGTAYAADVARIAAGILEHRFPLLGTEIETGDEIHWRRDYLHGIESAPSYFRCIPYLNFEKAGDHKIIWELNRHQHLVLLAQAYLLTGDGKCFSELLRQWESWLRDNPYQCGINWASALEVAFRALSWIWVYHLVGRQMPAGLRSRFLSELYRHGLYLEFNLSRYFSPNTHLLGEAVALHALGALFPCFPRAARWRELGGHTVTVEVGRQVYADGAHFEQSSYYHLYALDFFLFHYVLERKPEAFDRPLKRMANYLHVLLGPCGNLPLIGDDDGGRVFHPYGGHGHYARATLATCSILFQEPGWLYSREDLCAQAAWWLEGVPPGSDCSTAHAAKSRVFTDSGLVRMDSEGFLLLIDAGGFGALGAGHSHSDSLSFVAWHGNQEVLIDPGTYTYVADRRRRDWFRGTAAHNTVRIDGKDQAIPFGPFRWTSRPSVTLREHHSGVEWEYLDACCSYEVPGMGQHRRRILFIKPNLVFVVDEIQGDSNESRLLEQFWHPAAQPLRIAAHCFQIGSGVHLVLDPRADISTETGGEHGWRSRALAQIEPAPVIIAARRTESPATFAAVLVAGSEGLNEIEVSQQSGSVLIELRGAFHISAEFPAEGLPNWHARDEVTTSQSAVST